MKYHYIGAFIRQMRTKCEISQGQLSRQLGYSSPQYISNLERGLCGLPPEQIVRVSEIFEIPADVIISVMLSDYREYLEGFKD